ncbi:MAG: tRNA lysidine(34) synthetase TilS [Candidatus Spechtbacterales bacterium]|nr:tRNA lysidine(34) synthetase TilS [Candidatus Spechtbacterales bacterium]
MIHVLGKIPRKIHIAVSGGPDSMTALDFLSNNHDVTAMYFHHGTKFGDDCMEFVSDYCKKNDIPLLTEKISRKKKKSESPEEYWRNERYAWFNSFDAPIVTAHNLDDAVEWYIFTSLHGEAKLIPYKNNNVIRPFLITSKSEFLEWAERKNVPFLKDPANSDRKYARSTIRHDIMPHALKVNPGLYKVVRKMLQEEYK